MALFQERLQRQSERGTMWHDCIYDLTPVEKIGDVWFKRGDKFSPDGMHNGSKFRQLIWLFRRKLYPGVASGAVTGSPQLPMVAACAKHCGMKRMQFTGAWKNMALAGGKARSKNETRESRLRTASQQTGNGQRQGARLASH